MAPNEENLLLISPTVTPSAQQNAAITTDSLLIKHTTEIVRKSFEIKSENLTLIKSEKNNNFNNSAGIDADNLLNNKEVERFLGEKKEVKKFDKKNNAPHDKIFSAKNLNFQKETSDEKTEKARSKVKSNDDEGQFIFHAASSEIAEVKRKSFY